MWKEDVSMAVQVVWPVMDVLLLKLWAANDDKIMV